MPWCRLLAPLILTVALACGPARADDPDGGLAQAPRVTPDGQPQGLVYLFSGEQGPDDALNDAARRISGLGVLVIVVDVRDYLRRIDATKNADCLYLISEMEGVSRDIQRDLGIQRYASPVVAGTGLGGAVALAALRQAPANTIAGAASDGFLTTVPTGRPLCPGETATPATKVEGGYRYGPRQDWPGFVHIAPRPGQEADASAFVSQSGLPPESLLTPSPNASLADRMAALLEPPLRTLQTAASPLGDLPVVEVPVQQPGPLMAVIVSGDGGWRDIDQKLSGVLQDRGVPTVGIDSLRYFWTKRTPDEFARDLAAIIDHYRQAWGRPGVVLIGYSFGADVLPAAANRLPPPARDAVREIALLAASPWANFVIHLSGWFTSGPTADSLPTPPELARLDRAKVQCFYGEDDKDETVCLDPALDGAQRIETGGGHHFDRDYQALAERILEGAERRG